MDLQTTLVITVIMLQVTVITLDLTLTIEINGVEILVDHLERLCSGVMRMVIVLQEVQGHTPTQLQVAQIIQEDTHIM